MIDHNKQQKATKQGKPWTFHDDVCDNFNKTVSTEETGKSGDLIKFAFFSPPCGTSHGVLWRSSIQALVKEHNNINLISLNEIDYMRHRTSFNLVNSYNMDEQAITKYPIHIQQYGITLRKAVAVFYTRNVVTFY